ncbi:MAG TPA: SLC13 family permease [Trueperaceae bacterium]|nr:SLC13 family permease [Trueperaceae bacterium]
MPAHALHDLAIVLVSAATLLAIGFGRVPRVRLDRAAVAAVGALVVTLLEGQGVQGLWRAIDGRVLLLLLAVMIVNAGLADAGAFRYLAFAVAARTSSPRALVVALVAVAGFLSALFLNDTVVLMLTPLVVTLARRLRVRPLPYLLALAMAANAGGVATLTGNPQNVLVGVAAGIDYLRFASALAPIALLSLAVVAGAVLTLFRNELAGPVTKAPAAEPPALRRGRLAVTAAIALGMVAAFVARVPPAEAALAAAGLVMATAPRRAGALLGRVDVRLLVLFAGLFVIVAALAATPVAASMLLWASQAGSVGLMALVALASNLLSNVPAVMVLLPAATSAGIPERALQLAMASTLAGNLTLVGSVANLIVAESARRAGAEVDFWSYARVGVPVTLLTLTLGGLWLAWA